MKIIKRHNSQLPNSEPFQTEPNNSAGKVDVFDAIRKSVMSLALLVGGGSAVVSTVGSRTALAATQNEKKPYVPQKAAQLENQDEENIAKIWNKNQGVYLDKGAVKALNKEFKFDTEQLAEDLRKLGATAYIFQTVPRDTDGDYREPTKAKRIYRNLNERNEFASDLTWAFMVSRENKYLSFIPSKRLEQIGFERECYDDRIAPIVQAVLDKGGTIADAVRVVSEQIRQLVQKNGKSEALVSHFGATQNLQSAAEDSKNLESALKKFQTQFGEPQDLNLADIAQKLNAGRIAFTKTPMDAQAAKVALTKTEEAMEAARFGLRALNNYAQAPARFDQLQSQLSSLKLEPHAEIASDLIKKAESTLEAARQARSSRSMNYMKHLDMAEAAASQASVKIQWEQEKERWLLAGLAATALLGLMVVYFRIRRRFEESRYALERGQAALVEIEGKTNDALKKLQEYLARANEISETQNKELENELIVALASMARGVAARQNFLDEIRPQFAHRNWYQLLLQKDAANRYEELRRKIIEGEVSLSPSDVSSLFGKLEPKKILEAVVKVEEGLPSETIQVNQRRHPDLTPWLDAASATKESNAEDLKELGLSVEEVARNIADEETSKKKGLDKALADVRSELQRALDPSSTEQTFRNIDKVKESLRSLKFSLEELISEKRRAKDLIEQAKEDRLSEDVIRKAEKFFADAEFEKAIKSIEEARYEEKTPRDRYRGDSNDSSSRADSSYTTFGSRSSTDDDRGGGFYRDNNSGGVFKGFSGGSSGGGGASDSW